LLSVQRELSPRNLDQIIAETFKVYGRSFVAFAGTAALVTTPLIVCSVLLWGLAEFAETQASGWSDMPYLLVTVCMHPFVIFVLSMLGYPLMTGALIHATCQQHWQQPVSIGQAYAYAWRRIGNLGGAALLYVLALALMAASIIGIPFAIYYDIKSLFILMAILAVGIPFAIYFGFKWLFAPQAVLVENLGPTKALSRSSELATGSWLRVFGLSIVVVLLLTVGWLIIGIPFAIYSAFVPDPYTPWGGSPELTIMVIRSIMSSALLIPFGIIANTLLYYDLRLRKEQFNIDTMAGELGMGFGLVGLTGLPIRDMVERRAGVLKRLGLINKFRGVSKAGKMKMGAGAVLLGVLFIVAPILGYTLGQRDQGGYAPMISGISVSDVTSTTATITWTTNELATSQVECGPTFDNLLIAYIDETMTTNHRVVLAGLSPGTDYYYFITSVNAEGISGSVVMGQPFTTLP